LSVYINREPWKVITPRVEAATQRVVAAMGYVGDGAHKLLPLAKGDLLVCDLSESAVKSGATNPEAILDFLKAKVTVRSRQGLHAKVVVLGRRAYVGSNNASDHSAKKLIEATIETTDSSEVKKLRKFVEQLDGEEITKQRIQELMLLRPKRSRTPNGDILVAELPDKLNEIKVLGLIYGYWTDSQKKAVDNGRSEAKNASRKYGTKIQQDSTAASKWVYDRVKVGDWVMFSYRDEEKIESPGVVTSKSKFRNAYGLWVARPKCSLNEMTEVDAMKIGITFPEKLSAIRSPQTAKILKKFR
jgi:hypothetical protein